MSFALPALLIAIAGAPASIDSAVTAVVGGLHLDNVNGFDDAADLALAVDLTRAEDGPALRPVVYGIARARLERLGLRPIEIGNSTQIQDTARRAGAEWLLLIVGDRTEAGQLRLFASLRVIDRGLWSPVPADDTTAIYAIAEHTIALPTSHAPPPPPPPTLTALVPKLVGPALAIASVPGRVVAMAACPLDDTASDNLVVVTNEALTVYSYDRRLQRMATFPFQDLPRAQIPVRDPVASVVCGDERTVAFGHTNLASGYVLQLRQTRGRFKWVRRAEVDGIPLATLGPQRWLLGRTDGGTNRFVAEVRDTASTLTPALPVRYALAKSGSVWFAVDTSYGLLAGGANLTKTTAVGRAGPALATWRGLLFHTNHTLDDGRDIVSMYSTEYPTSRIRTSRAVQSIAAGRFRADAAHVVVGSYRPGQRDTELLLLGLEGVETTP